MFFFFFFLFFVFLFSFYMMPRGRFQYIWNIPFCRLSCTPCLLHRLRRNDRDTTPEVTGMGTLLRKTRVLLSLVCPCPASKYSTSLSYLVVIIGMNRAGRETQRAEISSFSRLLSFHVFLCFCVSVFLCVSLSLRDFQSQDDTVDSGKNSQKRKFAASAPADVSPSPPISSP